MNYIVSFHAGTSGRFLASVIWNMMNDIDDNIPLSDNNSAHIESPWEGKGTYELPNNSSWYNNSKTVFSDLLWKRPGVIVTHTYPDFDQLRINPNLASSKVILITVEPDDFYEIASNCFVKNAEFEPQHPLETMILALNKQYELKLLDQLSYMYNYSSPELVPEDLRERFLLISYKEIYTQTKNGSYVALEKLKNLLNKDVLPLVFQSYQTYVNNRNRLWNK